MIAKKINLEEQENKLMGQTVYRVGATF